MSIRALGCNYGLSCDRSGVKFGLSCNRSGVKFGLSCDRSGVEFGLSCDRSGVEFGLSCDRSGVKMRSFEHLYDPEDDDSRDSAYKDGGGTDRSFILRLPNLLARTASGDPRLRPGDLPASLRRSLTDMFLLGIKIIIPG